MPLFTLTPAPLLLYAFRYRDERPAALDEGAVSRAVARHRPGRFGDTEWRIEGLPERQWPLGKSFTPWQRHARARRTGEYLRRLSLRSFDRRLSWEW